MRLFVAISLTPQVRDAIHADTATLRSAGPGIRWVAPDALHVTIKFLGEQDPVSLDGIRQALESAASRHAAVHAKTTRVGAFPNFRRPRVVWVGMTEERALQALARDIDGALTPLGIAGEARPFRAHITLGRVKGELGAAEATALERAAGVVHASRDFPVRTVDLMRSELGPGGSRYTVISAVPLQARGT